MNGWKAVMINRYPMQTQNTVKPALQQPVFGGHLLLEANFHADMSGC